MVLIQVWLGKETAGDHGDQSTTEVRKTETGKGGEVTIGKGDKRCQGWGEDR